MKRMCESIRRRNEYYRILYEDIRRREKALGRIRHELGNLFVLQLSYLESGRYEELRRLYLNLIESPRASGTVIHTGNRGLQAQAGAAKKDRCRMGDQGRRQNFDR